MNPINFKTSTYIDFKLKTFNENPIFEVGDCVTISKYIIII